MYYNITNSYTHACYDTPSTGAARSVGLAGEGEGPEDLLRLSQLTCTTCSISLIIDDVN